MKHQLWYRGLKTKAEKEDRKKSLTAYRAAFDDLSELMEMLRKKSANRDYSEAGWMQKQIAINEYNAALDDISNLMK